MNEFAGWFPFWFWNDALTADEIRWQISQMAQQGLRGFVPSPRQGLTIPYLSDSFFKMIAVAIDAAREHGMVVHLYDELPYPSGAAGGEVLLGNPHFHATALVQKTFDVDGGSPLRLELPRGKILNCVACPLVDGAADWSRMLDLQSAAGIVLAEDSYQEVGLTSYNRKRFFSNVATPTLVTQLPPGRHRIFVSVQATVENHKYYFHFVDALNPEAVAEFLRLTHDRYYQRFGSEFGKIIRSIFTDETTPTWSERLPAEFFARTGYKLPPLLAALQDATHPQHARVKSDFHRVKYDLFVDSFEKPYANWCREHGIAYWGEKPLLRLSQLKFSDVPGCDAGHVKAGAPLDLVSAELRMNPRAAASAAYFYDKPAAVCECYHSLGWGATLQDLKRLADGLLLAGISCFVPHAFFYSTHGLKKHDAPPSMFFQMPYWKFFGQMVALSERVLEEFEGSHIAAQVLIVDPTPGVPTAEQANTFVRIQQLLLDWRIDYLIVDVDTLRTARMESGVLRVKELYVTHLVVPPMVSIEPELQECLSRFQSAGLTIGMMGQNFDPDRFRENLPSPSLKFDAVAIQMVTRRKGKRTLWFLQNTGKAPAQLKLTMARLREISLDGYSLLQNGPRGYSRTLLPHESVLLCNDGANDLAAHLPIQIPLPPQFKLTPLNLNLLPLRDWTLTLLHQDHQSARVQPGPIIHQLQTSGLRFAPKVDRAFGSIAQLQLPTLHLRYTAEFQSNFSGPVQLVMEPGSIGGEFTIRINGSDPLQFSKTTAHIRGSLGVDISNLIRTGLNSIEIEIQTDRFDGGLLNCLYLAGDFGVSLNPIALVPPKSDGSFGQWNENGLPFYAGVLEYAGHIEIAATSALLEIPIDPELLGDDAIEVSFNNGPWHAMLWTPRLIAIDPSELHPGKNEIRLRAYTTLLRAFESQRFDIALHQAVDVGD